MPYTNFITLRGCGQRLEVESFEQKHGLRSFMIAPTAIIRGVGITFGMDLYDVPGTTGYYDSDLNAKGRKAAELFQAQKYDFGFIHVKATDDAGHDFSHKIKVEQFEKCDRMLATFIEEVRDSEEEFIIVVTGDHTTPTFIGDHTYEPVPIMMCLLSNYLGKQGKLQSFKDGVQEFNEIACQYGSLGRFHGIHTIPTLLKLKQKIESLSN